MFMKAVVEIKGGFGNQIFQYAFANYLKTKGYRVTVNINKSNVQRFPLDNKNFGFQESSKFEVALYKFLYFVSQKSVFKNSINKLITKIFIKEYNLESFYRLEIDTLIILMDIGKISISLKIKKYLRKLKKDESSG